VDISAEYGAFAARPREKTKKAAVAT
jgi:hypothetical protein